MGQAQRRILLTGGAGFIGSHVAEALLRKGHSLAIVDNLDDFYPRSWKEANLRDISLAGPCEFFEADIEAEGLRDIFAGVRPEVVVHLAARAGVRPSLENPRLYERVNIGGTVNLLEVCRQFGVSRFVFGSSSSVYGGSRQAPFSEAQLDLRPISPYAATKLAGEMLCYTYAHLYGLPVVCLRFFTVYGPRQRPDLAIHKFTTLIEAGSPVPIYGDGSSGRDYTYVTDIVAGVLAAIDYARPEGVGAAFDVFNLGNSHPVRLLDLVDALEDILGRQAIRRHEAFQPGDVSLTWADISKAGRLLGFAPATSIREGLEKFVAWYRATGHNRRMRSLPG
jgi:UDP-glucuronate 4-epimerase